MGVLHHVRHGIGATRALDHAPPVPEEIRAAEQERSEADAIAAEAGVHDHLDELQEPSCAEECGQWGDQEIGKMVREYRAGLTVADIAADLGEDRQAVAHELKCIYRDFQARKGGAATRGGRLTDEQRAAILNRYAEKRTIRHIACELGIAESTVRYVIDASEEL